MHVGGLLETLGSFLVIAESWRVNQQIEDFFPSLPLSLSNSDFWNKYTKYLSTKTYKGKIRRNIIIIIIITIS